MQASVSPLLADETFRITVLIRVWCPSSREAPQSTSCKLSDVSGWTEVIGTAGSPSLPRGCLLESGTFGGSTQYPAGSQPCCGPRQHSPWGSYSLCARRLGFRLGASPEPPPPALVPFGTTPPCHPRAEGRWPSGENSLPNHSETHPKRIPWDGSWPDCICVFGVITSYEAKSH